MEVHVPKAARSLREFAIELMTIVAGIVIAISLEQAVETIHWHKQVHTARDLLRQELLEAYKHSNNEWREKGLIRATATNAFARQ